MRMAEVFYYLITGKYDLEASAHARDRAEVLAGIEGLEGEAYLRDIISNAAEDPEELRIFIFDIFRTAWQDGFGAGEAAARIPRDKLTELEYIKALLEEETNRDIARAEETLRKQYEINCGALDLEEVKSYKEAMQAPERAKAGWTAETY